MIESRTRETVIAELQKHPELHMHVDLDSLRSCCFLDGAIDLDLIDKHAKLAPLGYNGGRPCDVISGPCSCGAWHKA